MPRRDAIHAAVRNALIKDGWTITDDPYIIAYDDALLFADIGAERTLAVERAGTRAVVEAKSFLGESEMREFETALGQYLIYRSLVHRTDPGRRVFLAVGSVVFDEFFSRPAIQLVLSDYNVSLIAIDLENEEIVQWKHQTSELP